MSQNLVRKISMDQLFQEISKGSKTGEIVLDVREPEEFREGHIPLGRNYPLSTLEKKIDELKKFERIYIHCQAGGRAQRAAELLVSKGLSNLVCVSDGGFGSWKASGYPVEK